MTRRRPHATPAGWMRARARARRPRPTWPVDVDAPHGFVATPGMWHIRSDADDMLATRCGRDLVDGLTTAAPRTGEVLCRTCVARSTPPPRTEDTMTLELTPEGRAWAEAHADDSIVARVALRGVVGDWPTTHVAAAVAAVNRAAAADPV